MTQTDLAKDLKNISEKDRKQIEQAQEMLGPDPSTMGLIKNYFWGRFRPELAFPYPKVSADETRRCDELLGRLDHYLRTEHPVHEIDQKQEIPQWAIQKLFDLGVLGMTIPVEFGGSGFGITSYNRVLERIGRACGSTAVLVSAHQSIGCKAVMLFGSDEQKKRFLPQMAKSTLSAFCLSEPNVGCDAGGQETRCELSADGTHYILNGEKKWATSGALSGLFTVMAQQKIKDPKTGKEKDVVTALICTPDMEGVDIFSRNRSKCGIRGTWQARIKLTNVKVPKANLLAKEGQGFKIAMTCLNYGRCTLSAGMLGGASYAYEQALKWAKYRQQFDRPIGEFDPVQEKLARMGAYVYAMDAMLYATTGFLDRGDADIMLETATCKVFCSEFGFRTVDDCLQVMGGESYMTENDVERIWRDSRINIIVEGANEVMHSFLFAYGSKQLGEWMLAIKNKPFGNLGASMKIGAELFLGVRPSVPVAPNIDGRLKPLLDEVMRRIADHSHSVKMAFKEHEERLVTAGLVQRRLALVSMWIHAMVCSISKLQARIDGGLHGNELEYELAIVRHLCAIANDEIVREQRNLTINSDASVKAAATAAMKWIDGKPNGHYDIPEKTPDMTARGTGKEPDLKGIPQFGTGSIFRASSGG